MNKKIRLYWIVSIVLAVITILILLEANATWKRILEPEPTKPAPTTTCTIVTLEPLTPSPTPTITISPTPQETEPPTPNPTPTSTATPKPTKKPTPKPVTISPTQTITTIKTPPAATENTSGYVYNFTESEKIMFATLIKLEAGDQSWECQLAVGSVVLNRLDRHWGGKTTLKGIIYANKQFSPAYKISYTKPTQMQLEVVEYLCKNGVIDNEIVFFYYKRYSDWGTPAYHIGTEYFSKS